MLKYLLPALLGLLLLLLFAPVELEAVWRREVLHLRLRLLWVIPVPILPRKEKPDKPRRSKKQKPQKEAAPAPARERKGAAQRFLELLQLVNDLLPHLAESAGYIMKRLTLSRCRIALVLSGEEASEVGMACGRAYALGHSLSAGLRGCIRVREFVFNVLPDYLSGREAADAEISLRVRPSTLLAGGILFLWRSAGTLLAALGGGKSSRGKRPSSETNKPNLKKAV